MADHRPARRATGYLGPARLALDGPALQADLGLVVSEPDRAVDADRWLFRVGDDHQGLGAQLVDGVPGGMTDQRGGQALAARTRMGADVLIARDPGSVGVNAEMSYQFAVAESARTIKSVR